MNWPGDIGSLLLAVLALLFLLLFTMQGRKKRRPLVRPLPAFEETAAAIGHSAESGTSVHFALGSGRLGTARSLSSIAAMESLEGLVDAAVAYETPPVVTVGDPTLLPIAEDILRRAYVRRGIPERYNPTLVRYIADQPVVYAAGAALTASHPRVYGNVLLGSFDEEVSLISQAADRAQAAATDSPQALAALYPSVEALGIGEELFAGPATLAGLPHYLASLQVQDLLRFILAAIILIEVVGLF